MISATMFLSVSGSLPTTSYVKMIEVWLIFSFLIPFLEVLILSLIHLKSNSKQKAVAAFQNINNLMLSTITESQTIENLDIIENISAEDSPPSTATVAHKKRPGRRISLRNQEQKRRKKDKIFVAAIFMRDIGVPILVLIFICIYCIAIF